MLFAGQMTVAEWVFVLQNETRYKIIYNDKRYYTFHRFPIPVFLGL